MSEIKRYRISVDKQSTLYITESPHGDMVYYEDVEDKIHKLETALHEISLCSQNSTSSKDECGRIARAAMQKPPVYDNPEELRTLALKSVKEDPQHDAECEDLMASTWYMGRCKCYVRKLESRIIELFI